MNKSIIELDADNSKPVRADIFYNENNYVICERTISGVEGKKNKIFGAQWGITLIMRTLSCLCVFAAVTSAI